MKFNRYEERVGGPFWLVALFVSISVPGGVERGDGQTLYQYENQPKFQLTVYFLGLIFFFVIVVVDHGAQTP
jgi:hypothetical protein